MKKDLYAKAKHTVVILPDNSRLEVSYFCSDKKLKEKETVDFTELIVQLHDCHCSYKIRKDVVKNVDFIERLVQKTVLNAKGHLC